MTKGNEKKLKSVDETAKPAPEPVVLKTNDDLVTLASLLNASLGTLKDKPFHWAYYALDKLQRPLKAFQARLALHPDAKEFNKQTRAGQEDERFKGYRENAVAVRDEELQEPIEIRRFRAEWMSGNIPAPLAAALLQFGLLDDPTKFEEMLYSDEE
ncbi:hypothetical protein M0R36_10910 [bacterium]|jgi:hypothetical protein|nr:hypothetical protein [bacterium]